MNCGLNKERIFLKKLYLDIETLPASGEQMRIVKNFFEEYKKKSSKKSKDMDFDQFFRSTSFSGEFGRIFCVGYAVDDAAAECLRGGEKEILEKFWQLAKDANLFIGHNILEFDLRFIYKRSVINRVKPTQELSFARYRNSPIFDTMKEWEKWGSIGIALHKLAIALSLESPKSSGVDGSMVYDLFLAGKTDEIIEYCKRDVEATRKIYKRINFIS
ncbi:hypothetical protein CO019_00775 [Candidatus Berkelbacteria bacterium CG_4_9_14_0_2_um_filter_42_30]|uniref:Predicted 3'-5' exonuclease PolB-like domain-containing protein n=6 Tax=Candidatus Berkelbacteria TaxID=1618330 RepID=A0A2M7K1G7_9BACT|nr:MAG: hypothetical protein AUJ40_00060 [Candidatus Berkelbacteria bacterium CG1_02_42_45]PIP50890.1 MAG: hypothetical protein COX11_01660 [Candidatus Berkelbacteria bacterium CG23_combo_of_CG06-09_8_20_14_all_41_73]PIR27485.1 MAG: hypothetical protein COV40_00605 [Candidatus Berkelbacteria bacterium CG11_big_fil_rev_8_21_14_0_20_42_15]PIX30075.1 MAG: hypothetical protein COZ63_01620 [Candidatus Berkelbacteria bacterium CG_4_8_14_3_um_filter_42_13]PIZ27658.1 MAG: hypothetical protein COY45_013